MPNKNYVNGRRKEYKIVNSFKEKGNIAFRSAGSHSPIDVIAINEKERKIFLIQCKSGNITDKKIKEISKKHEKLNGLFLVSFVVL